MEKLNSYQQFIVKTFLEKALYDMDENNSLYYEDLKNIVEKL